MNTQNLVRLLAITCFLNSILFIPERGEEQTQPSNSTQADQTAQYARLYDAFKGVQELRIAVPTDAKARVAHLNNVRSQMAVPDEVVPGVRYLLLWNHVALVPAAGTAFQPRRLSLA